MLLGNCPFISPLLNEVHLELATLNRNFKKYDSTRFDTYRKIPSAEIPFTSLKQGLWPSAEQG